MSTYISDDLKQLAKERAGFCCEYCFFPDKASYLTFHFDHILSRKHGGLTTAINLAYACPLCNLNKGRTLPRFWIQLMYRFDFIIQEKTIGINTFKLSLRVYSHLKQILAKPR